MVAIVDFGSKKNPNIVAAVERLGYKASVFKWDECDENKLKSVDKIILSGAPILLTEIDHQPFIHRFAFLKNSPIPLLGICFGHQLIGLIYGAEVFKGEPVRKNTEIEILKEGDLFEGISVKPKMMEDHTEGITLPGNFMCLARSGKYDVEAMKHVLKPIYGVQFHPEVSGENGESLLANFLKTTL